MSVARFADVTGYSWSQTAKVVTITIPILGAEAFDADSIDLAFHAQGFALRLLSTEPNPLRLVLPALQHAIVPAKSKMLRTGDIISLKLAKEDRSIAWTDLVDADAAEAAATDNDDGAAAAAATGPSDPEIKAMMEQRRAKKSGKTRAAAFWGQRSAGIDDLVAKVSRSDPKDTSIFILPQRKLDAVAAGQLAAALATNTTLHELYASGHSIGSEGAASFSRALTRNTSLRTLCVGSPALGDAGVAALATGVAENLTLHKLDLEHKGCGPPGAISLGHALGRQLSKAKADIGDEDAGLRELTLARNQLGDDGAAGFCNALVGALTETENSEVRRQLLPLQSLDLSQNEIGSAGAACLGNLLGTPGCQIQTLRASGNPEFRSPSAFVAGLALGGTVKILGLSGCGVGDAGMAVLSDAGLAALSGLRELDVSDCRISSVGISALAAGFQQTESIHLCRLKLSGNDLSDVATIELADALRGSHLEYLDVGKSSLCCTAALRLVQIASLQELKLTQNALGDEICHMLSAEWETGAGHHGERADMQLEKLDLANNGITGAGATSLCASLHAAAVLPRLKLLVLGGNPIGSDGEAAAQALMEARPELKVIFGSKPSGMTESEEKQIQ